MRRRLPKKLEAMTSCKDESWRRRSTVRRDHEQANCRSAGSTGVKIDKRKIELEEPIRTLGVTQVP